MSEKVVGRSQTPSKGRPSNESNAEKSQDSGINIAVQAQFWHNSWTFGLWDNLTAWKLLTYFLIAWGLYEMYWATSFEKFMEKFWPDVNTGLYRFTILAIFTTFFIQFKDEVVGAGNTIRNWFEGFQMSNPFLASVVEASATVALSTAFYDLTWGNGFDWDKIQLNVLVVALYVTPIFYYFNGWMKSWTLGGKWGAFIFTYFVFWPIFLIVFKIFADLASEYLQGKDFWTVFTPKKEENITVLWDKAETFLWTLPTGNRSTSQYTVAKGSERIWNYGLIWPFVPKQAFAWIFWMSHNYISVNIVPAEYAAIYTFCGNFLWNIVLSHFILGTWVCNPADSYAVQNNCNCFFKNATKVSNNDYCFNLTAYNLNASMANNVSNASMANNVSNASIA